MKRKLDARSLGAGLVAGSLAGVCGGYVLARSRARREYATRLDKAVSEVKERYSRPLLSKTCQEGSEYSRVAKLADRVERSKPGTKWADVIKAIVNDEPVPDPLEGIGTDGELIDDGEEELSSLGPVPDSEPLEEPPFPFEISSAQFGELADEGFQTISVTYYAADKVLCDDKSDPIRDAQGTVGILSPLGFGGVSGDPRIRYVRNRRLEVDFEILLDTRSFAETVLNYGQPNRAKEKNTGAKATG